MNQPCRERPLSALISSCESCIKTHFFSPTSEAHFVSRSSRFKLRATVNVILAAAVTFCARFSSSMFCTYWASSVCLDPSSVETQQFHLFFPPPCLSCVNRVRHPRIFRRKTYWCLLLWVRAAPGRCVAELEGKKKKIRYTGLLLICSVFVFRQLRLQGCLLLLLIAVRPWHLVRTRCSLYLLPGCLNSVSGLSTRCERDANVAFIEPTQRRFNCHDILLASSEGGEGRKRSVWQYFA